MSEKNGVADIQNLEHLLERRTHELRSIKLLVKQKVDETQKIIDVCGERANYSEYGDIKTILSEKLNEAEGKLIEARKKVKDIRAKQRQLINEKNEADQITASTVESTHEMSELKISIQQLKSEFEIKSHKNSEKRDELKRKQNELESYQSEIETSQKFLDNLLRSYNEMKEEETKLKQQQTNLRKGTETAKALIKEAKSSINTPVLVGLQREVDQLERTLKQTTVNTSLHMQEITDPDDLDPLYQEQINSMKSKITKLKQTSSISNEKFDEMMKNHKIEMNEMRMKLDILKKNNNSVRSTIEAVEASIPQTIAPLTRELEKWRTKVETASKTAKESETKINIQRSQAEAELFEVEKQYNMLRDEVTKSKAQTKQQKVTNTQKQTEIDKLRSDLNNLKQIKSELEKEEIESKENMNKLNEEMNELNNQVIQATKEMNEVENKYLSEIEELKCEVEKKMSLVKELPDTDVGTSAMNENEIRASVEALEKQLDEKQKELAGIREKYEKTEDIQRKFEAALDLMTDLEDEEKFMLEELRMIRQQFGSTIRSLKNK